jgi:hypothetical protein
MVMNDMMIMDMMISNKKRDLKPLKLFILFQFQLYAHSEKSFAYKLF